MSETRLHELQSDVSRVDETIARLLNEKTRLACEIMLLSRTAGAGLGIDPTEAEIGPQILKIAQEGLLGPEGMKHIFRQVENQAFLTALRHTRRPEPAVSALT